MRNFYQFLPAFRNEKKLHETTKTIRSKKRILNLRKIQRKFSLISANLSDKISHSRDRTIHGTEIYKRMKRQNMMKVKIQCLMGKNLLKTKFSLLLLLSLLQLLSLIRQGLELLLQSLFLRSQLLVLRGDLLHLVLQGGVLLLQESGPQSDLESV